MLLAPVVQRLVVGDPRSPVDVRCGFWVYGSFDLVVGGGPGWRLTRFALVRPAAAPQARHSYRVHIGDR